jgi:hypothetical protein
MKTFGKPPKMRRFTPRKATRGGYSGFLNKEPEAPLTGEINGLKAAKGEERLARALNKKIGKGTVQSFFFRSSPGLPKGVAGWRELDFEVATTHGTIAISVEGASFVHLGETSRNKDKISEMLIMERLAKIGRPVPRIERVFDYELKTQADAEKILKRLGIR